MKKINYNQLEKFFLGAFLTGTLVFIISSVIVNYNSRMFFNFDMYSDAYVAKLMWEEKTFFPEDWVFGNQFYIAATPVLAAILYGIIQNSFLSLATASCLMTVFVLLSFIFCFKKAVGKDGIIVGLFCMLGGILLGTGISTCLNSFQLFYTMASYYSIYLIGVLLAIGTYLQIKNSSHFSIISVSGTAILFFALGMNSLREMLVLCLPLIASESLFLIIEYNKEKNIKKLNLKPFLYTLLIALFNLAGIILIRIINPDNVFMVEKVDFTDKIQSVFRAILNITGLSYSQEGIKYFPLFALSVFLVLSVLFSLFLMIKKRDNSNLARIAYFSVISLLAVSFAGVFIIKTRSVYYFIWYLLVVCCIIYLFINFKDKIKCIFLLFVLFGGMGNYFYNVAFDLRNYLLLNESYEAVAEDLKSSDINCFYVDIGVSPFLTAYSDDDFVSGSVRFDFNKESGYLMYPNPYLLSKKVFENSNDNNKLLLIPDWRWRLLENEAPPEYIEELKSKLELAKSFELPSGDILYFYRMTEKIIA